MGNSLFWVEYEKLVTFILYSSIEFKMSGFRIFLVLGCPVFRFRLYLNDIFFLNSGSWLGSSIWQHATAHRATPHLSTLWKGSNCSKSQIKLILHLNWSVFFHREKNFIISVVITIWRVSEVVELQSPKSHPYYMLVVGLRYQSYSTLQV